eukprot:10410649-Karenia_brevis.AAC.1
MFGCPEDWSCGSCEVPCTTQQARQHTKADGVLKLCHRCTLPVCRSCQVQLATARGRNNVRYVQDIIARYDARWIEFACASLCWATLETYQLEEPHGHLMNSSMQGPFCQDGRSRE